MLSSLQKPTSKSSTNYPVQELHTVVMSSDGCTEEFSTSRELKEEFFEEYYELLLKHNDSMVIEEISMEAISDTSYRIKNHVRSNSSWGATIRTVNFPL